MPHAPKLTPKICNARVLYLWRQFRRGNIRYEADIERKIRSNLPAREHEIADLKDAFNEYMSERDVFPCDNCGILDSCEGDGLCYECYHREYGEET